jgi:hypothetical protein
VFKGGDREGKIRVVFDGSAKEAGHKSFNEISAVGPTLQPKLVEQLLRFRSYRVAVSADITQMFPQIRLDNELANVQRIVWRRHPSHPLKAYTLPCVTFGTSAATFLATVSLAYAARDTALTEHQKNVISSHFYVDDLLTGGDDIETVASDIRAVFETLNKYHLKLRKSLANKEAAIKGIPQVFHLNERQVKMPLEES